MSFHLIDTNGFHATAANERFLTAGSRRGVVVSTTDLTISRCRFTEYAKKKCSNMRAARAARFNIIDFWRFRCFFRRRFPSTSPMSLNYFEDNAGDKFVTNLHI